MSRNTSLYVQKYVDQIRDENNPFLAGLAELDQVTIGQLLKSEGASSAAIEFFGGSTSALQMIGVPSSRSCADRLSKAKSYTASKEAIS